MAYVDPPLVSVLVPAFNAERTIATTLRSALAQSWANIEIIVVDDGSTDNTPSTIGEFAERFERVRAVSIANGGQSAARNLAISMANGKYVAPLDSDDIWHPSYLQKLVTVLDKNDRASFAYAFLRRIDQQGRVTQTKPGYAVSPSAFHQMLAFNVVGTGSAIVARTTAVRSVGGYQTGLGGAEDYLLQLRLAAKGAVLAVPEYLVGYRTGLTSLSTKRLAMSRWSKRVMEIAAKEFPEADRSVLKAAIARSHADAIVHAARARRFGEALQDAWVALTSDTGEAFRTLMRKARSASVSGASTNAEFSFYDLDPQDYLGETEFNSPALVHARTIDQSRPEPRTALTAQNPSPTGAK